MRTAHTKVIRAMALLVVGLALTAIGAGSAAGAGHRSHVAITVAPAVGSARTTFIVRFRAPSRTGRVGALTRSLNVIANGPASAGCVANVDFAVDSPRGGASLTVRLDPGRGARWCNGVYTGTVEQIDAAPCPFNKVCVGGSDRLRTIGHFVFRVHK